MIGTYLALAQFLGQASQQRFTSRKSPEQWDALKGPSGIERLEQVRRGLRGRAIHGSASIEGSSLKR